MSKASTMTLTLTSLASTSFLPLVDSIFETASQDCFRVADTPRNKKTHEGNASGKRQSGTDGNMRPRGTTRRDGMGWDDGMSSSRYAGW